MINIRCCNVSCGVLFGLPDHVYDQAKERGKTRSFYCPNGHQQWYSESEEDRQRARADRAEELVRSIQSSYESERRSRIYWHGIAHRKSKAKANGK